MISPETSAITYTTFATFCARVKQIAFPSALGERHKPLFDLNLKDSLIKAQKYIDCLRKLQASFFTAEQINEQCGVAVLTAPRGKLNAVYAFKPCVNEDCSKYFYRPVTPHFIACWQQENKCQWQDRPEGVDGNVYATAPANCAASEAETGEEEDDTCYKSAEKFYAKGQNGELYLAPRPACGYIVAVHWEGLRRSWASTDAIVDDPDLIDWVAEVIQGETALAHGRDPGLAGDLLRSAALKFSELMYWCNEERRTQAELDCGSGLDTGNLSQMFAPIYPYAAQE